MLKFGVILVLSVALFGTCYGKQELRQEEREDVPLDFLLMSGSNDQESLFGYQILEFLHNERMRCEIQKGKEELRFGERKDHLMRYYLQTKQTISLPDFEELARANKNDLEHNFRKAFKDIEIGHLRKLSRLQTSCDRQMQSFLADKMRQAVQYSMSLLETDMTHYTKLLFDISEYRVQLQYGLRSCIYHLETTSKEEHYERAGDPYDLCYGTEVTSLVELITNFTEEATRLMEEAFHVEKDIVRVEEPTESNPDLEDGDDGEDEDSGDGEPENEQVPTDLKKVDEIVNSFEPGPVIVDRWDESTTSSPTEGSDKKEDKEDLKKKVKDIAGKFEPGPVLIKVTTPTEKAEPTTMISKEDLLNKVINSLGPGPVQLDDKDKPVTKTDLSPTTESKIDLKKIPELFEPGPVVISDGKSDDKDKEEVTPTTEPTKEYPEWAKDGFETVVNMGKKKDSQEDTSSSKTQSRSHSKQGPPPLSIDLDLPGVDAGLDVQIGPGGVQIDAQGIGNEEIVFDAITTTEEPAVDPTHGSRQFKVYFLIYFFATLGVLLGVTMLILIVLIVRVKMSQRGRYQKDTPLISEEEKIAVMKKSGYVNPTYQFFDQVEDV